MPIIIIIVMNQISLSHTLQLIGADLVCSPILNPTTLTSLNAAPVTQRVAPAPPAAAKV